MENSADLDGLLNTLAVSRFWSLGNYSIIKPRKHHTLLDGLALLFIKHPTRDVAAVGMTRKQINDEQHVTFWLAMNGGCDPESSDFARMIMEEANKAIDGGDIRSCFGRILPHVILRCSKKIHRRRSKVAHRFTELLNDDLLDFRTPTNPQAVEAFNVQNCLGKDAPSIETWTAWLRNWFDQCFSQPLRQEVDISQLLCEADSLVCAPALLQSLNDDILKRRMRKLAQYIKVVTRIANLASKEKRSTRFAFKPVGQSSQC
jgi:hypothetical protein